MHTLRCGSVPASGKGCWCISEISIPKGWFCHHARDSLSQVHPDREVWRVTLTVKAAPELTVHPGCSQLQCPELLHELKGQQVRAHLLLSSVSSRGQLCSLLIPREQFWRDSKGPRSSALGWGCHRWSLRISDSPRSALCFYWPMSRPASPSLKASCVLIGIQGFPLLFGRKRQGPLSTTWLLPSVFCLRPSQPPPPLWEYLLAHLSSWGGRS